MRKELYISEGDIQVFERVKELAGEQSMSAVVMAALREWLERRESTDVEAEVYEVQPRQDKRATDQAVKFRGVLLAEENWSKGGAAVSYELYRTTGGNIVAVHRDEEFETPGGEVVDLVAVDVFADMDSVTRVSDQNFLIGGAENGEVAVPLKLWENAKATIGELEPRWIE